MEVVSQFVVFCKVEVDNPGVMEEEWVIVEGTKSGVRFDMDMVVCFISESWVGFVAPNNNVPSSS
jgi:hypothetical protein